jgi:hypothetical protein
VSLNAEFCQANSLGPKIETDQARCDSHVQVPKLKSETNFKLEISKQLDNTHSILVVEHHIGLELCLGFEISGLTTAFDLLVGVPAERRKRRLVIT